MKPDVVVDVGNSLIKWGRCVEAEVIDKIALSFDDTITWEEALQLWNLKFPSTWAVSGVNPEKQDRFVDWLGKQGAIVRVLEDWRQRG